MRPDQQYLKDNNIRPRLSLKDHEEHTVKLINCKEDQLPDGTKGVTYLVEEGDQEKTLFTTAISLISQLSMVDLGIIVCIKMYVSNNKTMFNVDKIKTRNEGDEIPIAEEQS